MRPSNKSRSRNKPGNNGNHNNSTSAATAWATSSTASSRARGLTARCAARRSRSSTSTRRSRATPRSSGDRVAAESYLQHSEHYSRLLGEAQRQQAGEPRFNQEREDGSAGRRPAAQRRRLRAAHASGRQPSDAGAGAVRADDDRSRRFRRSRRADRDPGGPRARPVETPEGRRAPAEAPAPAPTAAASQPDRSTAAAHPAAEPAEADAQAQARSPRRPSARARGAGRRPTPSRRSRRADEGAVQAS